MSAVASWETPAEAEAWRKAREQMREHLEKLEQAGLIQPLRELCRAHSVLLEVVLSPSRTRRVVQARTACCLYLRTLEMSYPEIGKVMLRDHASIMALIRKERHKTVEQFERAGLPAPRFDGHKDKA